jgi:methyl-accepting chemotaxis protein
MAGVMLIFTLIVSGFALLSNGALAERENVRLLEIQFLQARQHDLDFVTFQQQKYAARLDSAMAVCDSLLALFGGNPTALRLDSAMYLYKRSFDSTVMLYKIIGLTESTGIVGESESVMREAFDIATANGDDDLIVTLSLCRRQFHDLVNEAQMGKSTASTWEELERARNFAQRKSAIWNDEAARARFASLMNEYAVNAKKITEIAAPLQANRKGFKDYVKAIRPILKQMAEEKSARARIYLASSGVVILVTVIANVLIALFLSRRIAKPVNILSKAASDVAQGNYNARTAETIDSNDEIRDLAVSFDQMTANIRKVIGELQTEKANVQAKVDAAVEQLSQEKQILGRTVETILRNVHAFAEGDLNAHINVVEDDAQNEEVERLYHGFNAAVANIRFIVENVTDAAEQTALTAKEILEKTAILVHGLELQRSAMDVASERVGSISAAMSETTQKTMLAAVDAEQVSADAAASENAVRDMIEEISLIGNVVHSSADVIAELGESSRGIGDIAEVIEEIADQTNLLALNAAIEAARAGEQGRGFAVVADEVRKLAERTQQATKQITATISQIQKDADHAVQSMNAGKHRVERGETMTRDAGGRLQHIIEHIHNVSQVITSIAESSARQVHLSVDIVETIGSVRSIASDSAESVGHIQESITRLQSQMRELQELLQYFRAKKNALIV